MALHLLLTAMLSGLLSLPTSHGLGNYSFRALGTEDGLNSRTVYCAFQDSAGKLWFGTDSGLAGLDSFKCSSFRNLYSEDGASGINVIHQIIETTGGGLLLGTASGLWRFDRIDHSFSEIPFGPDYTDSYVRSISSSDDGAVWAGTLNNGVFRCDLSGNMVSHWKPGRGYVSKILVSKSGDIWCAVDENSLWRYDAAEDDFVQCLKNVSVFSFCEDSDGSLLLGGWNSRIVRFDPESGYVTTVSHEAVQGRIHSLHLTSSGIIMFGSDAGLGLLDPSAGIVNVIGCNPKDKRGLSDNFVYDVLRDREGGLWVTTYFGGVCYSAPNSRAFSFFTCSNEKGQGRITSSICQGPGKVLYVGTDDGGLFEIDGDRQVRSVILDPANPSLNIHAVLYDGSNVWVGTYGSGLYRYNIENGASEHYSKFSQTGNSREDSVYSLLKDSHGILWIGTKEGIFSYDGDAVSLRYNCGLSSDVIHAQEDADGDIWFASTRTGLIHYHRRTDALECIPAVLEPMTNLTSMCLCGKYVVFGLAGDGVCAYDRTDGSLIRLQSDRGDIRHITAYSLTAIRSFVWIASDIGLICYDTESGRSNIYDSESGLHDEKFSYNSSLATEDLLLLGTNSGINVIDTYGLRENLTAPGLELSPVPPQIFKGEEIGIDYSVFSYCSSKSNRIKYSMTRSDNCVVRENVGKLSFNNLSVGKHRFSMQVCNGSDVWSDPVDIEFEVVRHWWKSIAAYILYSLLLVSVVLSILMLIMKYRRQKSALAEEQRKREDDKIRSDAKIDLFSRLARQIKTPLMLISAPASEALKETDLPEKVRGYLSLIQKNSDNLYSLLDRVLDFRLKVDAEYDIESDEVLYKIKRFADDFSKTTFMSMPGIGKDRIVSDFMAKLDGVIVKNISNQDLDVDSLAENMHTSRTVLFTKVKEATGMTPNNYIKTIRLRTAAEYIAKGDGKISEVCYLVGFSSPSYFARCFRDEFGVLPKDFNAQN